MSHADLKSMSVEHLVSRHVEIGVAQDEAILDDDNSTFNQLYDKLKMIERELKARSGDQRCALIPLYQHSNMQVRLNAARATLAVAPQAARNALESISRSRHLPQAGDAGMALDALDRGTFKPT
jgi:enoyl reductase-like protein